MNLIPVLILLFAGWMLWGWVVADHCDIGWLRRWCSILFTTTAVVISAGAGSVITRKLCQSGYRQQIRDFAAELEQQLSSGQTDAALQRVRFVVQNPDEWSGDSKDILDRLSVPGTTGSTTESVRSAALKATSGIQQRAKTTEPKPRHEPTQVIGMREPGSSAPVAGAASRRAISRTQAPARVSATDEIIRLRVQ